MSDITPLATYHSHFRLPFWPDRQPANSLQPTLPEAGAASASLTSSDYQPAAPLASAADDARLHLSPRPSLLTFSFFGSACLP